MSNSIYVKLYIDILKIDFIDSFGMVSKCWTMNKFTLILKHTSKELKHFQWRITSAEKKYGGIKWFTDIFMSIQLNVCVFLVKCWTWAKWLYAAMLRHVICIYLWGMVERLSCCECKIGNAIWRFWFQQLIAIVYHKFS